MVKLEDLKVDTYVQGLVPGSVVKSTMCVHHAIEKLMKRGKSLGGA